jgi:hypothetical protein
VAVEMMKKQSQLIGKIIWGSRNDCNEKMFIEKHETEA